MNVRCSLTRAIALHARHQYPGGSKHGHLYRIEVTVTGPLAPHTRMVMDLATLDQILTEEIAQPLGGRDLHEAVPVFASEQELPSCEALAAWCWSRVAPRLPYEVQLDRVRVAEDGTLWADCTGPS